MRVSVTDEKTALVDAKRETVAGYNERISLTFASTQGFALPLV
jgi:hypothetical protein